MISAICSASSFIVKLVKNDLQVKFIINTDHHFDHIGGNFELKENYNSIGYSATDVRLHLNKIYSIPFYLTLTTIIGALLMFRLNFILYLNL